MPFQRLERKGLTMVWVKLKQRAEKGAMKQISNFTCVGVEEGEVNGV